VKIALVDYGAGNLTSVRKALAAVGAAVVDPSGPNDLADVTGVIVPGVGHFGATRALGPAWIDAIRSVVEDGRPLLGICLGMQWLYEGSDEAPACGGLGLFSGRCYRLGGGVSASSPRVKVPHVGWNTLEMRCRASIVNDVASGAQVYFTHSFVAPITAETVAVTEHGERFASVVQQGLIAGVQFHPEKSGDIGLQVLRNWLALAR
jgi:imidazole glycerol-phosphate synthase subunit HisH